MWCHWPLVTILFIIYLFFRSCNSIQEILFNQSVGTVLWQTRYFGNYSISNVSSQVVFNSEFDYLSSNRTQRYSTLLPMSYPSVSMRDHRPFSHSMLNTELPSKTTEQTDTPKTESPKREVKKRQNPLFVGPIEDDFPLDDPYFDHNGNISSFMTIYSTLHDSLMDSNSKRLVVYFPMKETGLGNCLLALSSSFIYAALTKRAFLVNYYQFSRHFRFQFKALNSTYTFSRRPTNGFCNWNRHYNTMQPTDKSMRLLSPRIYHRTEGVIVTGFLAYLQFIIRHDNFILKLSKMGFIDPSHINYTIPINVNTSSMKDDAYYTKLAVEAMEVFLRNVMKPQPWVNDIVMDVLRPYEGMHLIGMHLRMGNSASAFHDSHVFLQGCDIERFERNALYYMKSHQWHFNNTRWVLSTDSNTVEDTLRKKYNDVIITSSSFKRGHSKTGAHDPDGFSRAVIDLLLLSHCDYLVLTSHSTFSIMAKSFLKKNGDFDMMPSRGYNLTFY